MITMLSGRKDALASSGDVAQGGSPGSRDGNPGIDVRHRQKAVVISVDPDLQTMAHYSVRTARTSAGHRTESSAKDTYRNHAEPLRYLRLYGKVGKAVTVDLRTRKSVGLN